MNRVSQICVFAGLTLGVLGLAFGLVFNYAVDHEARLVEYDAYRTTFEAIMEEGGTQWEERAADTTAHAMTHRRAAGVHTHAINMGVVLLLSGLLVPLLARGDPRRSRLAVWGLIGAAWIYPLGLLVQFAGLTRAGQTLAGVGAALAIAALILLFTQVSAALKSLPR